MVYSGVLLSYVHAFLCLSILKNIYKQQIVRGLYILFEYFDWLYTYRQPSICLVLFLASSLFSRAVIWVLFTSLFNTTIYFLSKISLWLLVVCVKTFVSISRINIANFLEVSAGLISELIEEMAMEGSKTMCQMHDFVQ